MASRVRQSSAMRKARGELQRARNDALIARYKAETAAYKQVTNSVTGGNPTRLSESWPMTMGYQYGTSLDRQDVIDQRSRGYNVFDRNPVGTALVECESENVIGDGLNYQPTTDSTEWNTEAQDKYYKWLEGCSVAGSDIETGCELQKQLWERSRVAGDIGWLLVSRGAESFVQTVAPENISTPDKLTADRAVYDGIRFDPFGRPIAFYIKSADEYGKRLWTEILARDFVYLPHRTKPNQARPPSCYSTIFDLLSHLDRYVDGVSLAAWMATVMGIIFKQNNASKQLAGLATLTNSQGNQQKAITFENGMVKYIGTDEEVAQVQAQQPMQQTPEFIRAMFRMIGQPFRMPLEVIAMDMSTCNFASARIGLLPFYKSCRIKANRFGARWSRTIRWWLSRERQRADGDPKKWKTAWPEDYWNHNLVVNAWTYTDPVSEPQGDFIQLDMKTKSPQMVITEQGRDKAQIIRDWKEWQTLTADLPATNSTLSRHPQTGVGATGDPLGHEQVTPTQTTETPPKSQEQYANQNGNGDMVRDQPKIRRKRSRGNDL